jgi:hypothetical protein
MISRGDPVYVDANGCVQAIQKVGVAANDAAEAIGIAMNSAKKGEQVMVSLGSFSTPIQKRYEIGRQNVDVIMEYDNKLYGGSSEAIERTLNETDVRMTIPKIASDSIAWTRLIAPREKGRLFEWDEEAGWQQSGSSKCDRSKSDTFGDCIHIDESKWVCRHCKWLIRCKK